MFYIRRKDILLFKIVHLTYYTIKRKEKRKRILTFQIDPLSKQLHSSTTQQSFFGQEHREQWKVVYRIEDKYYFPREV